MTTKPPTHFFNEKIAQIYDERNSKLLPISENMQFLIRLVLQDLPVRSNILCVGVGTGAEIISLSKNFREWTFVGIDPSQPMLEVCHDRLAKAGVLDRCKLIHGYVEDVPDGENFEAALSILVAHFIKREARLSFFQNMVSRLKQKGYLINAEIGYDLNSHEFSLMFKNWEQIQTLMGATPESLANLPQQLRDGLSVVSNTETENFLRQSGIQIPIRFFQSFMITAWYGQKID